MTAKTLPKPGDLVYVRSLMDHEWLGVVAQVGETYEGMRIVVGGVPWKFVDPFSWRMRRTMTSPEFVHAVEDACEE